MEVRKKPVVVEAVQWNGCNFDEVYHFTHCCLSYVKPIKKLELSIQTLEGEMIASKGDWIIKGVNGEFYPCKPDIFEKTYEIVGE